MGRAPCCDKANVKKGPWSPEEDAKLKSHIDTHGTGGNWIALPHKIGLKRCGKSCRLRWLNYLRPNIKHGGFTQDEDNLICSLYVTIGSRWSVIAAQLPGRTDNDIKNYWNTRLKKKLLLGSKPPAPVMVLPPPDQFPIEAAFHDQPVSWAQQQQLGPVGFTGFEETVYQVYDVDGGFSDNMMINPNYHVFHDSSSVAVDGSVNWDDRKMGQGDCSWMGSLLFDEPRLLGHS